MIRPIFGSDAGEITRLLQILRKESPEYEYVDDDPEYVSNNLAKLIYAGVMKGVVMEDDVDQITGFMIGFISNPWYSRRIDAIEQLLYIHPDHRGGAGAIRLIRKFECICREAGAHELSVGASTGMNEERTIALYQKLGYRLRSPTLVKRL